MAKASGGDGPSNPNIPGFLTKTYEIFSSGEYNDLCGWGPGGDTIMVKKIDEFSKQVLPKYFKHSNFQSFVRQLNMYDFHKTVQDPAHGEFQHQYFLRDRPDLLQYIKRKAHGRASTNDAKKRPLHATTAAPANGQIDIRTESDAIMTELVQLRMKKDEIEHRLSDMEYKQTQLITENVLLKNTMEQAIQKQELMKQKMQKILYFMYDMYMNSMRGPNGQRRLDGMGNMSTITNIPEHYSEALRLLDLDLPNPRVAELGHPMIEDDAGPRITEVDTFDISPSSSTKLQRLASFDTAAAKVHPPTMPFGRLLSIEAPTSDEPTTTSAESNPATESKGAPLQRMYSVAPTSDPASSSNTWSDSSQITKRQRTSGAEPNSSPSDSQDALHTAVSNWNQNQENLMTRIDSLDATLTQLLTEDNGLGLEHLPSFDYTYTNPTNTGNS